MRQRRLRARRSANSVVRDHSGQPLGAIEELIVDRLTGRVAFAVVALEDDTSVSDARYLPVPWGALSIGADGELCAPISTWCVGDAPTVGGDELDELVGARDVGVEIFSYYGVQPPWESARHATTASEGDS